MLFDFTISTPDNTLETAKQETILTLAQGIITHIEIQFPPGPNGFLHLQIRNALHQLFPYNLNSDFASSNTTFSFHEHIPFLNPPFLLSAFTWNLDDTFDHIVIVRIGILPVQVAAPWLLSFTAKVKTALGVS